MVTLLTLIFDCITGTLSEEATYPNEKQALNCSYHLRPLDEIAGDVVDTILRTNKAGTGLKAELDAIVSPYGWKEYLAEKVLEKLGSALQGAHENLGPVIRDAYRKAWCVANDIEGFVIQHPVMCTVIALGVLVIVCPCVIEALGFAELGPVEGTYIGYCKNAQCGANVVHLGSFASWWQSTYGGLVPKNSLFSFFQRLGMVWLRH